MFCLYPEYYLIPWPDSQRFGEIDPEGEHTVVAFEDGDLFAEKEWNDQLDSEHELP